MTIVGALTPGLVPMHIGLAEPGSPGAGPRPRPAYGWSERPLQERSALAKGDGVEWAKHRVLPRWLGQESGDCVVALEPGIHHNYGDVERKRFLAGAADRGETALLVSSIGNGNDEPRRNPLFTWDASARMPLDDVSIGGPRLLVGSRPQLADGLGRADRDLGQRLLNRPPDAVWWSLEMEASQWSTGGGTPLPQQVPNGELHPILVDIHGAPVVAAWIPATEDQRWYILPDGTDWNTVIGWLIGHALPVYAPGALRRARHATFIDLDLQTPDEFRARQGLSNLDDEYAERKAVLQEGLRHAEERATPVRNGLLYGTGEELVAAVAQVLADAGLTITDLDRELGATESADLLATDGPERRLIEVKSAGGSAGEKLVDFLRKHLETWPTLRPGLSVGGGVLIVNHQHKLPPQERTATVYDRKAFVDSLAWPVLSTGQLYAWWRVADWQAIRDAIIGPAGGNALASSADLAASVAPGPGQPPESGRRVWRWRSRSTG
jgi:hypothetical protein